MLITTFADLKSKKPFFISAATKKNLAPLLTEARKKLEAYEKKMAAKESSTEIVEERKVFRPHLENPKYFSVEKTAEGIYHVHGKRIEQIAAMTNFENKEGAYRLYDVLKKMGVQKELKKLGAGEGDQVLIGTTEIEFHEV